MPYYHKLGEMPRKHHIWSHRNGAAPTYKNEGIAYEHVITTEGFNEAYSIMYHLRPPTRVRSVKLLKCEEPKKSSSSSKVAARSRRFSANNVIARKITSSFPGGSHTGSCRIRLKRKIILFSNRPDRSGFRNAI